MIELKLTSIYPDPKTGKYLVYLCNDFTEPFSQERQAKKFLVEISKKLTTALRQLNECYRQIIFYSQNFIFSLDQQGLSKFNRLKHCIDERILFISHRYTAKGNNSFYFKTLLYIANCIESILILVLNSVKKIKYTGIEFSFEGVNKVLSEVKFKIMQIGNIDSITILDTENYDNNYMKIA
jgi:hypothetical protein